jgi:ubiquinol-cytochrome c reductase subunit 10
MLIFSHTTFHRWVPSLVLWGGAAAGGVTLYMSQVPIFQNDVLKKFPGLDAYFKGESSFDDRQHKDETA